MGDAVPAWAYEEVEVLPYDPRWAQLAAQYGHDRDTYTNAKTGFIAEALRLEGEPGTE